MESKAMKAFAKGRQTGGNKFGISTWISCSYVALRVLVITVARACKRVVQLKNVACSRRYCNTGSIRNDGPAGRHTNHRYEPIYLSYPGRRRERLVRLSHWEHHRVVRRFTSHAGIRVLNGTGV